MRPRNRIMGLFGLVAERQPPWFHEGHFLRPAGLRQWYLNVLRRMSGALPLPPVSPNTGTSWREFDCEVLIAGGGVAGLTAASAIARAGRSVLVVSAGRESEGPAKGYETRRLAEGAALDSGCMILKGALCLGLYENPRRALCADDSGALVIRYSDLVVATGAYDRLLPFLNNDLPGIIGVRALEHLLARGAVPSGFKVAAYGELPEIRRALQALARAGRRAHWIAGPSALPQARGGTPAHPNVTLQSASGRGRIRSVMLTDVGRAECDLLVLGFSQRGYELQMQRQCKLQVLGLPAILIPDLAGTGILAVGEAAGDAEPSSAVADAASRTREWLRTGTCEPATACASHPRLAQQHPDAFICPCEDVRVRDIQQAIDDGYDDIELIKRHTGAATGPCQGKLCHGNLMTCLAARGIETRLPTQRPLVRPVPLALFAGAPEER